MVQLNQFKFPDELQVRAPETDHAISGLSKAFSSLSSMLQESIKDISGSLRTLRQLPELLTGFQQVVVRQFSQLLVSELDNQIFSRHSNLLVAGQKLQSSSQMEKEKLAQLQPDSQRLIDRYQQMFETVAEGSRSQVNQMDAHAFIIPEKIYPKEVQERFGMDSAEALCCLTDHAGQVAVDRADQLSKGLNEAETALQDFLTQRRRFYSHLESFIWPSTMEPGDYEVPVLYIETRDTTTGNRQVELLLLDKSGQTLAVPKECLPWIETMVQRQVDGCRRRPLTAMERQKMGDQLESKKGVSNAERRRFESVSIEYLTMEEVA